MARCVDFRRKCLTHCARIAHSHLARMDRASPKASQTTRTESPMKTYLFCSCFRTELEALVASLTASGATCAAITKIIIHGEARYALKVTR